MSIPNIAQSVRASIAKAKDVALRANPDPAGAGAVRAPAEAGPVRKPDPPTAVLREGGGAAGDALRAAAAQRGGITATVVAALGGNRYVVDVDGKQAAVVLETAAAPDQRALAPGAEVRLVTGRDAAQAALAGATQAAADDPQFSEVAKLIASVVRDDEGAAPGGRGGLQAARLAVPAAPIADGGFEPGQVAAVLKQAVDTSGLFYEAHLAEWIAGRRSLEAVRREPQARLSTHLVDAEGKVIDAGPHAQREANAIVREQIHALQAQQFAWQCDLWRDQPGFLEIGRDPAPADTPPQAQTWRARIAIDLPNLGPLEIRMAITGDDIGVTFGPADPKARGALDGSLAALGDSLEARGLRPRVSTTAPAAAAQAPAEKRS